MLPRSGKTGRKAGGVSCFRFQNEYNRVEMTLRVVQFWSEIKLVITNRTPASRSCDFVITRLISDQIALHKVQLPLLIEPDFELADQEISISHRLPAAEGYIPPIIVKFTRRDTRNKIYS